MKYRRGVCRLGGWMLRTPCFTSNWRFKLAIHRRSGRKSACKEIRQSYTQRPWQGSCIMGCWWTRVSRELSLGKSLQKGLVDIWGMVGCCLAHEKALATIAQKQLGPTLILESDATLSVTAAEFQKMVHAFLSAALKQWLTIQLGCQTAGLAKSKRACVKYLDADKKFALHIAERCYLAHAYLISAAAVPLLQERLGRGQTPDGASSSLQSREVQSQRRTCFFLKPERMKNLWRVSDSWTTALRKENKWKYPTSIRGNKKSKESSGKRTSTIRKKGGKVHAGKGSSQ